MILIDFLDNNVKDTLILIKSLQPSKLVLVVNQDEESARIEGMRAAAKIIAGEADFNMDVRLIKVDQRDVRAILVSVKKEIESAKGKVYINISCENDLMTACAYNICTSTAIDNTSLATAVCVDILSNTIRQVDTLEELAYIKHLDIDDYLVAVGAKELEASRDMPTEEEYPAVCMIAEELFKNVGVWNLLCEYISKHYSHDHDRVRIPGDLDCREGQEKADTIERQLKAFCDGGVLEKTGEEEYRFTSEKHKGWMVVFGVWLEMYIYIKLKPYVDEVRLGLVVDWDAGDGFDTKDNELDVVAIKNSRPIIISCKMRMPTKEDIYEVGYITDRICGNSGQSAIATTAVVERRDSCRPGLFPRFKKMDLVLLETIQLKKGEDECRRAFEQLF